MKKLVINKVTLKNEKQMSSANKKDDRLGYI